MRQLLTAVLLLACGCNLNKLAADGVSDATERGAPAVQEHWDYQMARAGIASGIMRLEGIFRISPDNPQIQIQLARAYAAYGYGYVEDDLEQAEIDGEFDEADHLRLRAKLLYERGLRFAKRYLRERSDGELDTLVQDEEQFRAWLQDEFDDPEDDAEPLLWCGYIWALRIRVAQEPADLIDLPLARALVERSVELDESYMQAAGITFMATVEASIPAAMGGEPERGRELFERALQLTERKALSIQLNYARSYAVNTGNRELYESLLREVVEAGDVLPEARLSNKIARRRAHRSLRQIDELF